MKRNLFILAVVLASCNNARESRSAAKETSNVQMALADTTAVSYDASKEKTAGSAAMNPVYDRGRKVIRKAYARFRTPDVFRSSLSLEDLAVRLQGYVSYTHINGYTEATETKPINRDSALEVRRMNYTNRLVLHVPHKKLDSFWQAMGPLIQMLDSRKVEANTLVAAPKGKQTEAQVQATAEQKLAQTDLSYTTEDGTVKESYDDLLTYARVELDMYQFPTIRKTVVPNAENLDSYKPGFWSRFGQALSAGAGYLQTFFLIFVEIWPFLLIAAALIWWFRRMQLKKK
ncbi:MAG: hypothetical protein JNL57_00640 [Bacteroidetes bacterium]|nr:hypothetical protein [Bacteroidota bacterium]